MTEKNTGLGEVMTTASAVPTSSSVSGPDIPPESANFRQMMVEQGMVMMGSQSDPLTEKLNDEHIHKIINNDESASSRNFWSHIFNMILLVVLLIIVLAFIILFCKEFAKDNPQLVEKVLIGVISFAGGIGAGLGAPKLLTKS